MGCLGKSRSSVERRGRLFSPRPVGKDVSGLPYYGEAVAALRTFKFSPRGHPRQVYITCGHATGALYLHFYPFLQAMKTPDLKLAFTYLSSYLSFQLSAVSGRRLLKDLCSIKKAIKFVKSGQYLNKPGLLR
jgi:hypothetical protein